MYIRNKETGVTQECHNQDVIKICRKDTDTYEVTEYDPVRDSEDGETALKSENNLNDMKVDELRMLAKERGIEGVNSLRKEELLEALKTEG